jgi:hypothetical protein
MYSLKDGGEITVMYDLSENRKVPERHQGSMLFGEFCSCSYFGVEKEEDLWYNIVVF